MTPAPPQPSSRTRTKNPEKGESGEGPTCVECGHTSRDLDAFHEHLEEAHDAYTETTRRYLRDPQAYYG